MFLSILYRAMGESDRQLKYEAYTSSITNTKKGVSADLFPLGDVRISEQKFKKIKQDNPELKILLGDINFYAEKYLLCTSKDSLKETHSVFSTETRRYWCQKVEVAPRIETNQGKDKRTSKDGGDKKTFNNNCLLTVDQAVKMLCCYVRFKIMPESKIRVEEFEDLGIAVFLDFLKRGKKQNLWILEDTSLGEFVPPAA